MKTLYLAMLGIVFLVFSGINLVLAQTTSHVMGKFLFSAEIQNLMLRSCGKINDLSDVDPQVMQFVRQNNPNTAVSNNNAQQLFWNTLYTKFVSQVPEFKYLGGKNDTISIEMGEYAALSCPPIQGGNATFQVNGNNLTYVMGFYSDGQAFYYKSISFIHTKNQPSLVFSYGIENPIKLAIDPPLKQFKSGIAAKDVKCNPGLVLAIKSEDGSPRCLRPDTLNILVKRGLVQKSIALESTNSNQVVSVSEIKMVPPYTPGGPMIQLTLENTGMVSITSLKALLELNNNYTFDFTDVTPSKPLEPNGYVSNTTMLIGAGFQTELPYPITITGIVNGIPFNFTRSVHIPYTSENNTAQNSPSILPLQSNEITTLENYTGTVTLGNQTYYFDTPNYTDAAYTNPVQVSFHDVFFTLFPSRFAGGLPANGCGGKYYWANAEFPDGARELLQIFLDSQSCNSHSTPIDLSTHTIPQAGLAFYDGKMKLLVSVETQVGKNIVLEKPSYDVRPFPICNTNPTKEKLVREKQKILTDVLLAEEAKHGGFANRTQNLPWSGIGYDCVDNALEVNILPQYFSADLLPKYFEKIRSIVGNLIDIALSPQGYATLV